MLILRCSELDRVFSCNGSLTLVPLMPARDGDEGIEGSLLHYLIAKRLVDELGATPPEGGLVAPVLPKGYKLPAFSAWIVDWAVRHVRETIPVDWSLMVEVPLAYEYALPHPVVVDGETHTHFILSGHMDVHAMSPDGTRSKGIDWKTGQLGADAAETNWQAGGYLGLGKRAWEELKLSEFTLAQPRIDEDATGIPRISTTELTGEQLDGMNRVLADRTHQALENRMEVDSGPKQCKYCPVGWRCPAIQAEKDFMKVKLNEEMLARLKAEPNDAELGDFVISARTLTSPMEKAEEQLHERLDSVSVIDAGCGVRITRTTRPGHYEIPDPVKFMEALRVVIPEDDRIAKCVNPSMTKIKDQIADSMDIPKTSKKGNSAQAVFDGHLRPFTEQKTNKILVFT